MVCRGDNEGIILETVAMVKFSCVLMQLSHYVQRTSVGRVKL